jgi:AraC-like DNA-binding protein
MDAMHLVTSTVAVAEHAEREELEEIVELRTLLLAHARHDGHTPLEPLCVYRFSRATTFTKAPAFGITVGVVVQGSKQVRIGGETLHLDASRLLVITRDLDFEVAASLASTGRPYLGVSLCFSPELVAKALMRMAEAGAKSTGDTMPAFVTATDRDVLRALCRIVRAIGDPLDKQVLVPLAIEEILLRLLRTDAAAAVRAAVGSAPDAARILDAMRVIRAESEGDLSVPVLARRVGMSPSHFAHRFRAVARTSPMRYVRDVRLERAKSLLAEPGSRAGEIATRVGFASASHFTREFKRRYGVPPSHFQKRC